MATSAKTPVMVLQEYSMQKGISPPHYNIIHAKEGTHDNEFHYEVMVEGFRSLGVGRSKQIAKHQAAKNALEHLQEVGLYRPGDTAIKAPKSEMQCDLQGTSVNSHVALLNELCCEHKMPFPLFTEISDIGPAHCKQFTYQCQLATITTRGIAGTKKQAKQIAAKEMIDRLGVTPWVPPENENLQIEDDPQMAKYIELNNFAKPNLALRIIDYCFTIKQLVPEKAITMEDLKPYFKGPKTEENLKNLLEKLDLSFMISEFVEGEPLLALKINTEIPFVIMHKGESFENAKQKLLESTFANLELLLS